MTYHFSTTVEKSFNEAVAATKEALKRHHFRVLSEINMTDNLKKGLNVDFRPYAASPAPKNASYQGEYLRSVPISARCRKSPSLITPTSVPLSSITGRPLMRAFSISSNAWRILVSGETEMTRRVITSETLMARSVFAKVKHLTS